jgi:hypothetical protein
MAQLRVALSGEPSPDHPSMVSGDHGNLRQKDRKQREEGRARRAHQNRIVRFLEDDLPVQLWVRLDVVAPAITATEIDAWKARWRTSTARWAPWGCDLWWDDAFKRRWQDPSPVNFARASPRA